MKGREVANHIGLCDSLTGTWLLLREMRSICKVLEQKIDVIHLHFLRIMAQTCVENRIKSLRAEVRMRLRKLIKVERSRRLADILKVDPLGWADYRCRK